jgi:hypothetical protein
MLTSELVRLYPKLWHMADAEAWPLIELHGLRSTAALLELFEFPGPDRRPLLREHRPRSVRIEHPDLGSAVVRDQIPLSPTKLGSCLTDGTTVSEFLELLNSRVFFWLQHARLERLLGARAYRDREHLVITVDTRRLLDHVGEEAVTLSRINSGSTVYKPVSRGRDLFMEVAHYPHPARRQALASASDVAELCVEHMVPDIRAVADSADVVGPHGSDRIWARPGSGRTLP